MSKLAVNHLSASYGKIRALWDVGFDVKEKSITCLLGPNGAGKTTTLRSIAGLLDIEAGSVVFDGLDASRMEPQRRVEMGMSLVPEGKLLFPDLSVSENLVSGAFVKTARASLRDRIEFVYQMFPILKEKRKQKASMLSGGQQQMVCIGRALMANPKLLMLDEPTSGLQPSIVSGFFELLTKLKDQGMTVLVVEQNVYESLLISDNAFILENGKTVLNGTGRELLDNPQVKKAYLAI